MINLFAINDWGVVSAGMGYGYQGLNLEEAVTNLQCDCYGPGMEYGTDLERVPDVLFGWGWEGAGGNLASRDALWTHLQFIYMEVKTTHKQYGIKDEVVLGTPLGTHYELGDHFGNLMRMCWELHGNRQKQKNPLLPVPTPLKKLKGKH